MLEHDGIPVAELRARRTHTLTLEENGERVPEDETTTTLVDVLSYGGWLDHTEFRVSFSRSCVVGVAGCSETDPEFEVAHVQGFAAGVYSGTTPTGMGSATWTGVMIGMESPEPGSDEVSALLRNGQPDVFLGDARIMIDDIAVHQPPGQRAGQQQVALGHRDCRIFELRQWRTVFRGRATFAVFNHQQWVGCVREHDREGRWREWQSWIGDRYAIWQIHDPDRVCSLVGSRRRLGKPALRFPN